MTDEGEAKSIENYVELDLKTFLSRIREICRRPTDQREVIREFMLYTLN